MNLLRQQMDESNHEMVNLLTQQIGTVFNSLIRDTNQSYQALTTQMGRIADFFAPHKQFTNWLHKYKTNNRCGWSNQ